jgi:PAS domain S-box-containing protein
MIRPSQPLTPKTRLFLVLALGGIVITLFGIALVDYLSTLRTTEDMDRYNLSIGLARTTDNYFQLAISKGKSFVILKDQKNKELMLSYFQKAKEAFGRLSGLEVDPEGQRLLYRLGSELRAMEFPLGILAQKAKKSDPDERLYRLYLKDATMGFDGASQGYVDHLIVKILAAKKKTTNRLRNDLLLAFLGALLAFGGMGVGFVTARQLNQTLVSETLHKERNLILDDVTEEAIMIHDQGVIVEANPALCRLLGYSPEEVIGQHVSKFSDPESTVKTQEYLRRGYPAGSYEITGIRKDGSKFPLLIHGRDIQFQGKKMRVSSGWDLTEWKIAEEALQEGRERFERFNEVTREGILIHENGIIVDMNGALEEITGRLRGELIGTDGSLVLSAESYAKVQAFRKKGYPKVPYEIEIRKRDGSLLPVEVQGREFRFKGKNLRVASFWDLRERKKAEEELKISEEKFRSFIENSYDLFHMMGLDTTVFYISPSLERILGYETDELMGRRFVEWVHPGDSERVREVLGELLNSKGATVRTEMRFRHKDGSFRVLESTLVNLLEKPSVRGVVVNSRDITDKKTTEEDLRRSEAKFRGLIEQSHDLITVLDKEGNRLYESPALERILGFKPGERRGSTFETQPPEQRELARKIYEQVLANPGVPFSAQLKAQHKDGHFIDAEMVITNLLDDPAVKGIVVNGRDVTARLQTEEALRKSEELFRSLIEKSNDVISLVGRDGTTLYVSPSVQKVMGYDPSDRIGRPFHEILFPDDVPVIQKYFEYVLSHPGEAVTTKARVLHKEGMWREIEGTATNHLDNPDVGGIILNYRDVTERVLAETEARENQERYRSLVESMPDAVLVHDENKILFANTAAVQLLGAESFERILDRHFLDLVPFEFRDEVQGRIRTTMKEGVSNEPAERKILRMDGKPIEVLVTSVPFQDRGRRVVLAILSDISGRKEAERKAQRFQRLAALGELAAGMAHEIRNPTAAISGQAQYILKKITEENPSYESLKDILVQCERLETLVRDTLDYSPEKTFEERTETTPRALMGRALWLAQTQFGPSHSRIQVVMDVPEDIPAILVHPNRMERVLVNLILNAFQAMPAEGGHLLLKAKIKENKALLRVQDDGKGFTDEELSRLFEPFYTSRKMGSGLGLAICQKIVGEHQGVIKAEKVSPHGAAFFIELPIKNTETKIEPPRHQVTKKDEEGPTGSDL